MLTPKHLIAMAASNITAARGKVNRESAKKEECRFGAYGAHRERR